MRQPAGSLVLDLETKRSLAEVGGPERLAELGVSLVCVYVFDEDRLACYREGRLAELEALLRQAELVIGFNLKRFDLPVLAAELGDWVLDLPALDLLEEVEAALGRRVPLEALARATLGAGKQGDGLDALRLYREGDWDALERYCLQDVRLTRDLYLHARRHGSLRLERRRGGDRLVPLEFADGPFARLLADACARRGNLRIVYAGRPRLVEARAFDGAYLKGYCHGEGALRTFRVDRIDRAEAVPSDDPLPTP